MINGRTVITTLLSVSLGTIALAQSTHQHGASNAPGMPGMMAQMRGSQAGHMEGMMQAGNSMHGLEELKGAEFDQAFMAMMIAHHQGAIEMADWVLEHGSDPQVLEAANEIKAAQDPEIQQMTTWLQDWYATEPDSTWMQMMDSDTQSMMNAMTAANDPDTAFLAEMIHHHQGAIDMAQLALQHADQQELRDLARDIIIMQAGEIHQFQTWLNTGTE